MKITAQEEYGLRCIVAVARNTTGDQLLSITEIARAEGISMQYVAKLMNLLKHHGLVESVRGTSGGFKLSRPAHAIAVIEVLQALGSGFEIGNQQICSSFRGKLPDCIHLPRCSLRPMWSTIIRHITDFLQHLTLHDLLEEEASATKRMERYMQDIVSKERVNKPSEGVES
jgi:Rrf2 family transcriptional regulator, iron-sulfur cluster assembly transcription factor